MNESRTALIAFIVYTIAVMGLAFLSHRRSKGKEFVGEYFLGSRNFGAWAFALTFAATNASGGTFVGFPSRIYTHGWTLSLWIAGYMILPLVAMGLIGKRMNQVARKSGALTIPDVLRERFASPAVGLVATSLLLGFMFAYLLAQFKAGGQILSPLLKDEPLFQRAVVWISQMTQGVPWVGDADPGYLLCLIVFSLAVIVYVVYGGFRAVVWTDVMQGIIMLLGVILMLFLALQQVGGLANANRELAKMTPPETVTADLQFDGPLSNPFALHKGTWIKLDGQAYRVKQTVTVTEAANTDGIKKVSLLRLTTAGDIQRVVADELARNVVSINVTKVEQYSYGAGQRGVYLTNPGPSNETNMGFMAFGIAVSFFIFWPFGATGQPSNMVRLMSFRDARTLRYSLVTVVVYYSIIYGSLVVIFCCARILLPGMEIDPDQTMPTLATELTRNAGYTWLAGLLIAALFAAVMSSVDSFLLVVSSSVVRDVYQRNINPQASPRTMQWLSYVVTVMVGVIAVIAILNPPKFLQDLIVFSTEGIAACFFIPVVLCLYWPRMTSAGTIAGMMMGGIIHLTLFLIGYVNTNQFQPYALFGLNPVVWDLLGSATATILVSLLTARPEQRLVQKFFMRDSVEQ